jgi:hypothetical protein
MLGKFRHRRECLSAGPLARLHAVAQVRQDALPWWLRQAWLTWHMIMLTCLVTVGILSILTTVFALSTVSILDNGTGSQGRGRVNLDPTATAAQRADLDAARRDFPCYRIEIEPTPGPPPLHCAPDRARTRTAYPHHQRSHRTPRRTRPDPPARHWSWPGRHPWLTRGPHPPSATAGQPVWTAPACTS